MGVSVEDVDEGEFDWTRDISAKTFPGLREVQISADYFLSKRKSVKEEIENRLGWEYGARHYLDSGSISRVRDRLEYELVDDSSILVRDLKTKGIIHKRVLVRAGDLSHFEGLVTDLSKFLDWYEARVEC